MSAEWSISDAWCKHLAEIVASQTPKEVALLQELNQVEALAFARGEPLCEGTRRFLAKRR